MFMDNHPMVMKPLYNLLGHGTLNPAFLSLKITGRERAARVPSGTDLDNRHQSLPLAARLPPSPAAAQRFGAQDRPSASAPWDATAAANGAWAPSLGTRAPSPDVRRQHRRSQAASWAHLLVRHLRGARSARRLRARLAPRRGRGCRRARHAAVLRAGALGACRTNPCVRATDRSLSRRSGPAAALPRR